MQQSAEDEKFNLRALYQVGTTNVQLQFNNEKKIENEKYREPNIGEDEKFFIHRYRTNTEEAVEKGSKNYQHKKMNFLNKKKTNF